MATAREKRNEAEVLFKVVDKNGDGVLNSSEIQWALSDYGLTDEAIEAITLKLMMHMDADGNGEIDLEEWCVGFQAWKHIQEQLNAMSSRANEADAAIAKASR